jgi:hypothetical protein
MPSKPKRTIAVEIERQFDTPTEAIRAKTWLENSSNISLGESLTVHVFRQRPKFLIMRSSDPATRTGEMQEYMHRAAEGIRNAD